MCVNNQLIHIPKRSASSRTMIQQKHLNHIRPPRPQQLQHSCSITSKNISSMISVTFRDHNFYNNLSCYHNCIQLISLFIVTIIYCIAGDPPLNGSVGEIGDCRDKISKFFNEYKNYIMYFKLSISKTTLFRKMC